MWIDEFWRELFPMFEGFDIFYLVLDSTTIYAFIFFVIIMPSRLFTGSINRAWQD